MIILITNTIVPYCYDIAHILGLPTNFSHRFRYRSRWIEHPDQILSMRGQDGLIVLRNFDTGDLIPIRFITIEEILTAGDINYIEFRLHDYFPIGKKLTASKIITQLLKDRGFINKENLELGCLVFNINKELLGSFTKEQEQGNLERWSGLLREIGDLKNFKNFGFLKILRLVPDGHLDSPTYGH